MDKISIIGICGSLRKDSFNRMAINVAASCMPSNVQFEEIEIGDLPHFNQDLEENPPESVTRVRGKIQSADAVLISVAEYNYSVSSVLKNAIEWASRPYGNAVLNRKLVTFMGASNGQTGTARAQYHLRQMLVQTDSHMINKPEVMISFAQDKFDKDSNLHDEKTREKIKELVLATIDWARKWKKLA
jgi:chromate reductase, NAD(P)H dehydrogenase (quinone)